MTLPTALPSSTGTRHRTHTVLIDHYSFGMRSIGCSITHLLLFWSTALSSSLLLSGFHLACTSTSLGAISFPCLLPCSGLLLRQRLIHSTWCYLVPGATLLGAVLIWYTVNRLLQQTLLHKPLPFYGFVFVFLSYSSYSSYSPSFLFCSLAGFHLECTSNSLGATSLWPAGLPKAIK